MQFTGAATEAFGGLIGRRMYVNGTSSTLYGSIQYRTPLQDDSSLIGEYDVMATWALTCQKNCNVSPNCRNKPCDDWDEHWKEFWYLHYDVRGCAGLDGSRLPLQNDDPGCWVGCMEGFRAANPLLPAYAFCSWRPDDPNKMYVRLHGYQACLPVTCSSQQWRGTMLADGSYWRLTRTLRRPPATWTNPYLPG
jgi:hypothetical protein